MTLFHATTAVTGRNSAEALSAALEKIDLPPSASGVHDRNDGTGLWEIGAYFEGRPDGTALALLAAAHGAPDFLVAAVGTRDWMAQVRAGLTPVHAGRFVVYGSHDAAQIPTHLIGLEIEAALAFGTGHHATTQGCLIALDRLARAGLVARNVADVGCGTGVLAMAAARIWPARVLASDIDPLAVETARANALSNRLGPRINCHIAAGFDHPALRRAAPFDLIFANILARPLRRLAGDMARFSQSDGLLILSGILTRQAAGVEAVYRSHGFGRRALIRRDEWTTLVLRRP